MKNVLVTGANRGIGLEICRQLGRMGFHIWLTARNAQHGEAAAALLIKERISVSFIQMDVTDPSSVKEAAGIVTSKTSSLDVLINNAGILLSEDQDILTASLHLMEQTFKSNAIGPLLVVQEFESLLKKGSRIINISSGGGSMHGEPGGWSPVYCISKTMLNAITRQLDYAFKERGVSVNSINPGWVKTDMGGSGATRSVAQGAETAVWLATANEIPTGKFILDKQVIPW